MEGFFRLAPATAMLRGADRAFGTFKIAVWFERAQTVIRFFKLTL